ncbi:BTAD domain-containing putative transcriptional regulator [Micromonospora sp. NPDC093277]|uniref:AfsR/SARP family transcriptional regulator n=1 Tax=Micromonospora sp. NPDC093277 TaxID=3364291 RepID=UPI003805B138
MASLSIPRFDRHRKPAPRHPVTGQPPAAAPDSHHQADPFPAPALRFHILGPLEVYRDGEPCTPTAPLQRKLLALLLLHGNELIPVTRIIDALWGHRPPRSALAALQMYVSAVRRVLSPGARVRGGTRQHPVLRTQPSGYVIRVEPGQLDLHRFRSLSADGRRRVAEGRCAEAGESFRQALAMWRGPALADLSRSDLMERYAVPLEAERLALLQERIGADLCQGRSLELVGELGELSARYPLRESFHQQLMLALYLSGGRAEALQVYQRAHRIMVDEAGVEPGPGLRALQQMILDGSAAPHPHHSAIWCPACADRPTANCRCRRTCQAGVHHPVAVSNRW